MNIMNILLNFVTIGRIDMYTAEWRLEYKAYQSSNKVRRGLFFLNFFFSLSFLLSLFRLVRFLVPLVRVDRLGKCHALGLISPSGFPSVPNVPDACHSSHFSHSHFHPHSHSLSSHFHPQISNLKADLHPITPLILS